MTPHPPHHPRCRGLFAIALALFLPPLQLAWAVPPRPHTHPIPTADPRIDPATGRNARYWPKDRLFDYQHLRLEVDIPDMSHAAFRGVATYTLAPVGIARQSLTLDASPGLFIEQVLLDGSPVTFTHDRAAERVEIAFPVPLPPVSDIPHTTFLLEIHYLAIHPGGAGLGLTFSRDDPQTKAFDPMCHAQGEADHNHLWFPCHESPDERLSSELLVTVPGDYEVVSNGKLEGISRKRLDHPPALIPIPAELAGFEPPVDTPDEVDAEELVRPEPDKKAASHSAKEKPDLNRVTYHWSQKNTHPAYLITMIVGKFDVVSVGGPSSARPGISMPVYGPLGTGPALHKLFARTPDMMAFFEERFGVHYPWEKYAQVACRNFIAGGMENTSCTTLSATHIRQAARFAETTPDDDDLDEVIAHELAHQWFGDMVNCRSWEHLWLNEGFATFAEALWAEHVHGQRAYTRLMLRSLGAEMIMTRGRAAPTDGGLDSNLFSSPDAKFEAPDNAYQKGALILNMLRRRLGDEAFFKGIRDYLGANAFREGGVESDDLRYALEHASGQSLERFFDQWVKRPGHPMLNVSYQWKAKDETMPDGEGDLTFNVEQTQTINAENPAYAFELPILLLANKTLHPDGDQPEDEWLNLPISTQKTVQTFHLKSKAAGVRVNPNGDVLCQHRLKRGEEQ